MMKLVLSTFLSLWLIGWGADAHAQAPVEQNYRLGAGDQVEIRVYGEDDMTVSTRLGDSGVISYPFLGEINARGLTVSELEQLIVKGLNGPYLIDPIVSVNIVEYRPFFLNGEVNKPGAIPYQPGITLRKAIAMGGGFTERANRSNADLLRTSETKARAIALDEQVKPGDIITIKQSFF
jgi:polysaccharide export outer membrane protein